MTPVDLPILIDAIRERHSCEATFAESVRVQLTPRDCGTTWNGEVHLFDVSGHPLALRCYAWSEVDESGGRVVHTVLVFPPVNTASDAVRAEHELRSGTLT
jgi:hypothetical protein